MPNKTTSATLRASADSAVTPSRRGSVSLVRKLTYVAAGLALSATVFFGSAAYAAEKPILIGQSVPMGMANFKIASAISDATRALVDAVNDGGGIGGRPVELITLQDDGTPEGYANNVAQLLEEDGVLAIINCVGDRVCDAAVPIIGKADGVLVGTISGATALRGAGGGRVFPVRGDYAAEAEKLARQMATIGILRAVIMSDATSLPEKNDALTRALEANHIKVSRIKADESALDTLKGIKPDALVLDLSASTAMTTPLLQPDNQSQLPPIVVSMADPSLVMTHYGLIRGELEQVAADRRVCTRITVYAHNGPPPGRKRSAHGAGAGTQLQKPRHGLMEVPDLHRPAGRGAGVRVIPVRGRVVGALMLQAGEEAVDDAHGNPGQERFDHRQHRFAAG